MSTRSGPRKLVFPQPMSASRPRTERSGGKKVTMSDIDSTSHSGVQYHAEVGATYDGLNPHVCSMERV